MNAEFLTGDAMALPFEDKSFDVAVMALVLFFVPDPNKGLAEMVRVTRPGGAVAAYSWDLFGGGFPADALQVELRAMGLPAPYPPSAEVSRMNTLTSLWVDAGLTKVDTRVIDVERSFVDFNDYWESCLLSATIGAAVKGLPAGQIDELKKRVRGRFGAGEGRFHRVGAGQRGQGLGAVMSWEFLVTSFIVVVSPGTGVVYTLAAGLSRGARASIVAAFGCTLGIVPHMAAAILGLAALLHTSALAFQTFKYLGVAYLLYMAWSTLRETGALRVEKELGARSALRVTITGILINILNPKLSIFFFAFLPQFISANEPQPLPLMLELSAVFMLMTFVVFVGYGLFAASIRDHVISRPRVLTWMRRTFAAAFVGLGAKLALSDR